MPQRADGKQRFQTLDGVERELTSEVLMITDGEGGLAVAGVMGGARSEIREETTRVLLEAAVFDPVTIRRSARAVGIPAQSAGDVETALAAIGRFGLEPAPRILIAGSLYLAGAVLRENG